MELSDKEKYIADFKELHRRKNNIDINTFKEKYPNAITPFQNKYANYFVHIIITLELIGYVGFTTDLLLDGGASQMVNSSINIACVLLAMIV